MIRLKYDGIHKWKFAQCSLLGYGKQAFNKYLFIYLDRLGRTMILYLKEKSNLNNKLI